MDYQVLKLIYAGAFWLLVFLVILWVAAIVLQNTLHWHLEEHIGQLWDAVLIGIGFLFGGLASLLIKK